MYWTFSEAARLAGISRSYLAKLIKTGVIEGHLPSARWIVSPADLRQFINSPQWQQYLLERGKSQKEVPDHDMNVREVAEVLGLPQNVVAVLIALGVVPVSSRRRHGLVLKDSLIQWYKSRRKPLDDLLDSERSVG